MGHEAGLDDQRHATSALQERMKELSCLYTVSQAIAEVELTRNDRIQRILKALPRAWRYPDRAVARIMLDDERFESPGFDGVGAVQRVELVIEDVQRGSVEVGYTSTLPADAGDPFIPEELSLLENVARQVSLFIAREEGAARRGLLEAQLRHADRLATIGQLAAGVAHEMNEPLSNILGFAQLALKAPEIPQPVIDDLREIVAASLRAREIVKKLLLFAHQTPLKKAPININELIEDALFLLEAGCERQGIKLIRQLAANLPTIEADPIQIRQVLVNLTVNAMQAIAVEGTVTIETRFEAMRLVISVADTGQGMSPETLRKVFNPFFSTKDVGEGTGLGLSVVHGIVTAHGGTIDAESREGQGSRFIVRLPLIGNVRQPASGKSQS